jgi:hypothetical protein
VKALAELKVNPRSRGTRKRHIVGGLSEQL